MRLLSLALLLTPALLAQNFNGQIQLKSLVPPISQPWKPAPALTIAKVASVSPTCSIPLLVVPPKEVDQQMVIAPPATGFAVRVVAPPVPLCPQAQK
ncbi:MAG TPA: hypothetical protein VNV86_03130 [Candidatus Acidoferrum sp.]|nr:hypothetical protein [Candidatus Acidoferrum sp.]